MYFFIFLREHKINSADLIVSKWVTNDFPYEEHSQLQHTLLSHTGVKVKVKLRSHYRLPQ
jgi:hypothetical protein